MNLFMGQNQEGFCAQTLHYSVSNLSRTENTIEPRGTAIRSTQHSGVDRLRTQTAHFDPVITVTNREGLRKADGRVLGGGIGGGVGLA
jgi:hypothetical protein